MGSVSKEREAAPESALEQRERLRQLAGTVLDEISAIDPPRSRELMGAFVSELFCSLAERERREDRRQKQAAGIAAAKARGVRFGPSRKPLPENFGEYYKAWQDGEMTMTRAAEACGISKAAFHRAAARVQQAGNPGA